jgi:hypothetical protein
MSAKSNIIDELRKKLALAAQRSQRGLILQPGAIGDCILTLPLAELMKETVCKGGVDIIGRTEYIGILPGRSCIDGVKSMETMELHRLFAKEGEFSLADGDPLITAFAEWTWITSFLGEPNSDFEQNLIFTANCSHSTEVMMLEMKPRDEYGRHTSEFYKEQFIEQSGLSGEESRLMGTAVGMPMIRPTQADIIRGKEILAEHGVMPTRKPVVIQPGSGSSHKCWQLENFLSIAKKLECKGIEVIFLLGPAEAELPINRDAMAAIDLAGGQLTNLPLAEVLAVLSNAAGYIGNDSGITHLAAALGVRTVAVYGPTDPALYAPVGPAVKVLKSRDADFTSAISEQLQGEVVAALVD